MNSKASPVNVRSAYAWTFAGNLVQQSVAFVLSMLLARFLTPADYGIVGMVLVFTNILTTVQNLGVGSAVIYFNDDESKLPTYYTATAATGAAMMLALFASAPGIAYFYSNDQIIPIVRALSFTLLLSGLRSVSQARITRSFRFRRLAVIDGVCGIGSAVVALILAWRGFGAWSLVTNLLLASTLQTIVILYIVPPRFTLRIDRPVLKKVLAYGLPQTGSNLLWKFYDNADYLVIGKLLGSGPLGTYTLAFRLATLVNEKVSAIISRVSFTTFAALKDNREEGIAHWLSLTQKVATVNFALLALLAVLGEDFVIVLLGAKWLSAILPMRILCVVGALKTLSSITSNMMAANGRPDVAFRINIANSILLPLAFLTGCYYGGVIGVAIAWLAVLPVTLVYMIYKTTQIVGLPFRKYLAILKLPVTVASACVVGALPAVLMMKPGVARLALGGTIAALLAGSIVLRDPWVQRQLKSVRNSVAARALA